MQEVSRFMKVNILIIVLIGFCVKSFAQNDKSHLFPIETKQKFLSKKYFYEGKKIESPYGLQIPLSQLQDSIVDDNFLVFKRSRNTAKIINLISMGFSLYAYFDRGSISGPTYWATICGIGAASSYFNIKSDVHLDRAVKRYNEAVRRDRVGFHYDRTHHGHGVLSFGVLHSF
ncbi:hypothetical protein [Sphingobacterium haloxyli]|uniref:DUF5683 domain-containing protein n=1 Tax=Sphingobacterium haloxyli TaxID=2100533 RepID=A0A2S9IUC4_9SPHI|nr:hypothetical protein [Sphingobacterium haloxyli]PRD44115.1 hypothetical protein C5745_19625 [Sphingobacterium haloxyli]